MTVFNNKVLESVNKDIKSKIKLCRQSFSWYCETLDVLPTFRFTKVKRCAIITYKHGR